MYKLQKNRKIIYDTFIKIACYFFILLKQQYIFIHDCIKDVIERKRQRELESENEGWYVNHNVYGNDAAQDNIYDNQAFGKSNIIQEYSSTMFPKHTDKLGVLCARAPTQPTVENVHQ